MRLGKWWLYTFTYRKRENSVVWALETYDQREESSASRLQDESPVRVEEDDSGRCVRIQVMRSDDQMDLHDGVDFGQLSEDERKDLLDEEAFEAETLAEARLGDHLRKHHPGEKLAGELRSRQLRPV
jgi:hypothetical protein